MNAEQGPTNNSLDHRCPVQQHVPRNVSDVKADAAWNSFPVRCGGPRWQWGDCDRGDGEAPWLVRVSVLHIGQVKGSGLRLRFGAWLLHRIV